MQKKDMKQIRDHFPALHHKINGYPLIYFDNASTAQVPQSVINAMSDYYCGYKANVGRGIYSYAEKATFQYEHARKKIAQFIGAQSEQIIFTANATDSINTIVHCWAKHQLKAGDEIIISAVEHHSNMLPWQEFAKVTGCILKVVPITAQGVIDMNQLNALLSPQTKLVAVYHTSNLVGGTNNIYEIIRKAHHVGAAVLVDACQSVAHQKIDVADLQCDFLVFSGHKLFGPTGVGVLYATRQRIAQMKPTNFGGGMVFSVGMPTSQFKKFPQGFEAGTPNISGVIGCGAAVEFVESKIDFEALRIHETMLTMRMLEGMRDFSDVIILSHQPTSVNDHGHMVTFVSSQHHAHDIAAYLDRFGIAVRAGNHCVQMYHMACNINASVRISFAAYNTTEEVDFCLDKLQGLFA